ncbi:uncharacterized protein METZ01_LOCUS239663, partial [marine metagenome]
ACFATVLEIGKLVKTIAIPLIIIQDSSLVNQIKLNISS